VTCVKQAVCINRLLIPFPSMPLQNRTLAGLFSPVFYHHNKVFFVARKNSSR